MIVASPRTTANAARSGNRAPRPTNATRGRSHPTRVGYLLPRISVQAMDGRGMAFTDETARLFRGQSALPGCRELGFDSGVAPIGRRCRSVALGSCSLLPHRWLAVSEVKDSKGHADIEARVCFPQPTWIPSSSALFDDELGGRCVPTFGCRRRLGASPSARSNVPYALGLPLSSPVRPGLAGELPARGNLVVVEPVPAVTAKNPLRRGCSRHARQDRSGGGDLVVGLSLVHLSS
jgi:hypothetical protein